MVRGQVYTPITHLCQVSSLCTDVKVQVWIPMSEVKYIHMSKVKYNWMNTKHGEFAEPDMNAFDSRTFLMVCAFLWIPVSSEYCNV